VILLTAKGVTFFSVYYNKAQRGPLVVIIEAVRLWYVRLGYIGLDLLRKTALVTKGMFDFSDVRFEYIVCKSYNAVKLLR